MKSPFPGMDPYLERYWHDVHHRLCTYSCDVISEQLTSDLSAMINERLVVETFDDRRPIYPDLRVIEHPPVVAYDPAHSSSGVATLPVRLTVPDEEWAQGYVEIKDRSGNLVTVVEFVSPANKAGGAGRRQYRAKQRELKASGVNLVEIDLTRAGRRWLLCGPRRIPSVARTTYLSCVWRAAAPRTYELYPATMDHPLPNIAIPLRSHDKDVVLPLQPIIDRAYKNGRHFLVIDYQKPCEPKLNERDMQVAEQLLAQSGLK